MTRVSLRPPALQVAPWLRGAGSFAPGAILVGPTGETVRVLPTGDVATVRPGGYLDDPCASMSRRSA
jgi:hypothetical protein